MKTTRKGRLHYETVWQFIRAKTKIDWQRKLLWWVLGPKLGKNEKPALSVYEKIEQLDFLSRRENGFWYSQKNAISLGDEINKASGAMQKVQAVGKINVTFLERIERIMTQLDKEFSAGIMLPNLSRKANAERVQLFMELQSQCLRMIEVAQKNYAVSQGVDIQRLTEFLGMFGKGMGPGSSFLGLGTAADTTEASPHKKAFGSILDMVVTKSAQFGLQLPDKDMDTIVVEEMSPNLRRVK